MVITGIESAVVELPLRENQRMGAGASGNTTRNVFVRLSAGGGLQGHGEASCWEIFTAETPRGMCEVLDRSIARAVIGRSPLELNAIVDDMDRVVVGNPAIKAATEIALWDLLGKLLGVPVATLLGGTVRPSLGLSYSFSAQDATAERRTLRELYERGYRIFKVKTGILDWRDDVTRIRSVLEAYHDIVVRLDFNECARADTLGRILAAVDPLRIDYVEQPFRRGDLASLARAQRSVPFRVCIDEGCVTAADLVRLAELNACDVISLKICKTGGLRACRALATIASAWGIASYAGAQSESRLGTTAALHLMLTLDNIVDGCDYYYPVEVLARDPTSGGFRVDGGRVRLPESRPGLGVDVRREIFEHSGTFVVQDEGLVGV
jgi:L-alanine-DL-glutamate epimerase-like enolase superfamily enzyme